MQASTCIRTGGDVKQTEAVFPPPEHPGGSLFVLSKTSPDNPESAKAARETLQAVVDILLLEEPQQLVPGAVRSGEQAMYVAFMKEAFKQASSQVWRSAQMSGMDASASVMAVMIKNGYGYCCSVGDHILFLSESGSLPPVQANKSQFKPDGTPCTMGGQDPILAEAFSFRFTEESLLVAASSFFWKDVSLKEASSAIESTPVFALSEFLAEKSGGDSGHAIFAVQGDDFISKHAATQAKQYLAYVRKLEFGEKRTKAQLKLETWTQAILDPAEYDAILQAEEPIGEAAAPVEQPVQQTAPEDAENEKIRRELQDSLAQNRDLTAKIQALQVKLDDAIAGSRIYKRAALAAMADLFKVWNQFPKEVEALLTRDQLEKMAAWAKKEAGQQQP